MKKIIKKRLVYINPDGNSFIGGEEYDGALSDHNILCALHTIGKTAWINGQLYSLMNGQPFLHITIQKFYQYEKSWYNRLIEFIYFGPVRRI